MFALIASVLLSSAPSAALLVAREGSPPILDPRTYRSPNGKYALFVDPTARDGSGPAKYKLSLDGKELWSREEPYTLYGAALGDDGVIAGYAYTHGYHDRRTEGRFCVAISVLEGFDLRVIASDERVRMGPEGPSWPIAYGVVVDEDSDRVIVRSVKRAARRSESGGEEWRVFGLATREFVGTVAPQITEGTTLAWLDDVRHVRGTPLQIAVWSRTRRQLLFGLLDVHGRLVAQVDPEFDAAIARDSAGIWNWTHDGRAIVGSPAARQFELVSLSANARATFEAVPPKSADAEWQIREIARSPAGLDHVPAAPVFETVELEPRGELSLVSERLPSEGRVTVGPTGRLFVVSVTHRPRVHVFDSDGKPLHVVEPEDVNRLGRILAAPDGGVWVELGDGGQWAVHDVSGTRMRTAALRTRGVMNAEAVLLANGRAWATPSSQGGDVVMWEADGTFGKRIQRHADGRWLREYSHVMAAPTGELCVSNWDASLGVHTSIYTRDGDATATFAVEPDCSIDAFTGKYALGLAFDGRLSIIDVRTGKSRRADVGLKPEEMNERRWDVLVSPDGREVWLVDEKTLKLRKYALPES